MSSCVVRGRWAAVLLLLMATACHEPSTGPVRTTLYVSALTTGGDPDLSGYDVVIDAKLRVHLDLLGKAVGVNTEVGSHTVTIEGVSSNCTVSGGTSRSVAADEAGVMVLFEILCTATGVSITTTSTGADNPRNYQVSVNDAVTAVPSNGSQIVSRLTPGAYTIRLSVAEHCTVVGGSPVTVQVSAMTVTPVSFQVNCVPVIRSKKIAYAADSIVGFYTVRWIEVVNVDGSGATRLGDGESPSWSSDGRKLAFTTTVCDAINTYYGYPCTGGLMLVDPEIGNVDTPPNGTGALHPSWAPSADTIAFELCCAESARPSVPSGLHVMSIGAGSLAFIDFGIRATGRVAWSPDGKRIAFACVVRTRGICIANKDGTGVVRLTDDVFFEEDPAWSPDGTRIAFTTYPGGGPPNSGLSEIAVMTLSNRAITRITLGYSAAWSPDGTKLVFAGGDGLYTINPDGSNRTRLTRGSHRDPAWRP